jgi:hypothetical protein
MKYLTDGVHLYEVADQRTVQNYGVLRGTLSYVVIRDCVSEASAKIGALELAALSEVPRTNVGSPEPPVASLGSGRDEDRGHDVSDI